jgi:hypothetical protein
VARWRERQRRSWFYVRLLGESGLHVSQSSGTPSLFCREELSIAGASRPDRNMARFMASSGGCIGLGVGGGRRTDVGIPLTQNSG